MDKEILKQKFYKKSNLAVPSIIWNWFDRNIITPLELENKKLSKIVDAARKVAHPEFDLGIIIKNFDDLRATIEAYDYDEAHYPKQSNNVEQIKSNDEAKT